MPTHRRRSATITSASASTASGATHDKFRRKQGAFDASLAGIRLCRDRGLKVGVRFTMTQDNAHDLPGLLKLVEDEGVDRFYFSHLNYAGRGNKNRKDDALHQMTRERHGPAVRHLLGVPAARAWTRNSPPATTTPTACTSCTGCEALSREGRHICGQAGAVGRQFLGVNVANIDNLGNVHPDTMWWHHTLGNVRERPFLARSGWTPADPLMAGLKASRARSAAAAAPASISTSAAATPACAPSSSPAIRGRKTRAAT
jgi:MoaA/NifB/PqqE/SkfB family radical SAM enzyme